MQYHFLIQKEVAMVQNDEKIRCRSCGKSYPITQLPSRGICRCGHSIELPKEKKDEELTVFRDERKHSKWNHCFHCNEEQPFKDTYDPLEDSHKLCCVICGKEWTHPAATPLDEIPSDNSDPFIQYCIKCKREVEVDVSESGKITCSECGDLITTESIFNL